MRIAFYAPMKPPDHPVASGDRMMARNLLAAWRLAGHKPSMASRFRSYDSGDPARQLRLRQRGGRIAERLAGRFAARAPGPDLWFTYHLYHKAPDWLGPAVSAELGIPYFIAEASFSPKQAGGAWDLGHRAVAEALGRAERVFQPNAADNECVVPLLRSPDRLVPLPPFLHTAPFRAPDRAASRTAMADRLGLDPQVPWLLTVAMMRHDQKLLSYHILAAALEQLDVLPWRLIIAGEGPAEDAVRREFAGFGERVRWVGMLDRAVLLQLYKAADLYAWPAVKEAWGMAFLEAQAAGLPVVGGRSGGVPGIVADGETGLLAPEGDASAFAGALRTMLEDWELRGTMGRAAERRAERHHDIAQAAHLLDAHLRAVMAGGR